MSETNESSSSSSVITHDVEEKNDNMVLNEPKPNDVKTISDLNEQLFKQLLDSYEKNNKDRIRNLPIFEIFIQLEDYYDKYDQPDQIENLKKIITSFGMNTHEITRILDDFKTDQKDKIKKIIFDDLINKFIDKLSLNEFLYFLKGFITKFAYYRDEKTGEPQLKFYNCDHIIERIISEFKMTPVFDSTTEIYVFNSTNSIDILGYLYDKTKDAFTSKTLNTIFDEMFYSFVKNVHGISYNNYYAIPTLYYKMVDPKAQPPTKGHPSDTGYDLHLVRLVDKTEKDGGYVWKYGTGICIEPPYGWSFRVELRSSFQQNGFTCYPGIIDRSYQGEIFILIKTNQDKEPIPNEKLPFKGYQLIPFPTIYMNPVKIEEFPQKTIRGFGGFGSTDKDTNDNVERPTKKSKTSSE